MCSAIGLLIVSPLLLAIGILVKLDGGPVFFRQVRVGHLGRHFRIWKFRTMVPDAEGRGPLVTAEGDPRITPVGRWLRASKMDELPQLLNVLLGEMSFVGPRPEVPRYVARYTPEQRHVLAILPGIADPASIRYLDEAARLARAEDPEELYIKDIVPVKIRIALEYAATATFWTDLLTVLTTITALLMRRPPVAGTRPRKP